VSYFNRHITPDEEGYLYFVKTPDGYLYGPYSNRANAANGRGQRKPYVPRALWDYRTRTYVPNPQYGKPEGEWEIVKAKLGPFEAAPKLSLKDKYDQAIAKLDRIARMLNDRGIDVEFD
jgi:hypothetical protein